MFGRMGTMPGRIVKVDCHPCRGTGLRSVLGIWHSCRDCGGTGVLNNMIYEPSIGDRVTVRSHISPWNGSSGRVVGFTTYGDPKSSNLVGYWVRLDGCDVDFKYCGADLQPAKRNVQ